ncbi:MAG: hypothetical protein RLZZ175_262 [Bacteroidota bacterium]|jgi:TetR/AcrR family transcriptional repressor of nem operon
MRDTRTEILEIGEMLIRTKGYHSFSYADIAKTLSIKNAAIHYHFPGKSDLGTTILQSLINNVELLKETCKEYSATDKLLRFIEIYDNSKMLDRVCIMGALSPCIDTLPEQMQLKLKEIAELLLKWLNDILQEGKKNQEFHFNENSIDKANLIVSSLLASLLLNKVLNNGVFESIKQSIFESVQISK